MYMLVIFNKIDYEKGNKWVNFTKFEMFKDEFYYDMWCVRDISNRYFNSRTSWHFTTKDKADKFLKLLNKAY